MKTEELEKTICGMITTIVDEYFAKAAKDAAKEITAAVAAKVTAATGVAASTSTSAAEPSVKVATTTTESKSITLYEYTEASFVAVGFTNKNYQIIKPFASTFVKRLKAVDDNPSGWAISYKKHTPQEIQGVLTSQGFKVSIVDIKAKVAKMREDEAAHKDDAKSTKAEKKETKVESLQPWTNAYVPQVYSRVKCYEFNGKGEVVCNTRTLQSIEGCENVYAFSATQEALFFYIGMNKANEFVFAYACNGETQDGKRLVDGGVPKHKDALQYVLQHGFEAAVKDGKMKRINPAVIAAYEAVDVAKAEQLRKAI